MHLLPVNSLTAATFAFYGDVIEVPDDTRAGISINDGTAIRYDALSRIDAGADNGQAAISLFVAQARTMPHVLTEFECHPLGSQAFMPLDGVPYLIAVAQADANSGTLKPEVFLARPDQGINLHKGVWHHPLLALHKTCRFLVVDRVGAGDNLQLQAVQHLNWQVTL
tara:strand:- start:1095 stop:1595 length:501 start_codon:yes stop_codon:yes gene_type:complete